MASSYFIRKRVHVEAIMWKGNNLQKIRLFIGLNRNVRVYNNNTLFVVVDGVEFPVKLGEYIIKDNGELDAMGNEEFDETYRKM